MVFSVINERPEYCYQCGQYFFDAFLRRGGIFHHTSTLDGITLDGYNAVCGRNQFVGKLIKLKRWKYK